MQQEKTTVAEASGQIYKNMKMGESGLLDLLPKVKDESLRGDLVAHMEGYQRFADEAKTLLDAEHCEAKDSGIIAKVSAKVGTAMNTMMDSTASHIAEMVIEGSPMGVTDSMRILHALQRSDSSNDPNYEKACRLSASIVSFEEKQIEKMKKYL